jgi:AraC family transcriptional regulator
VKKQLIGMRMSMSLADNKTGELWKTFMTRRKEVKNAVGSGFYSVQFYAQDYFEKFSPDREFEKWTAMEVSDISSVPDGMEVFIIPTGLYAVFFYKGSSAKSPEIFQYIFGTWLPRSGYQHDDRPHFEVLGPKYKNNDPDSEEEIWIPVLKSLQG